VVNIASRNAFGLQHGKAAYERIQGRLVALTRTAAGEWAAKGCVSTPSVRRHRHGSSRWNACRADLRRRYQRLIPMARWGKPEEMASIVSFLLSDNASFITGQTIIADGGQIACQNNQQFMNSRTQGMTTDPHVKFLFEAARPWSGMIPRSTFPTSSREAW